MEMRVEATLTERAFELDSIQSGQSIDNDGLIMRELKDYQRLFLPAYRDRTMIGILIMVFQRAFHGLPITFAFYLTDANRMERHKRFALLRPYTDTKYWSERR